MSSWFWQWNKFEHHYISQYWTKTKQSVPVFWATLYVVLWMSRSFDVQINAKRKKFVKSCINVIIITLFYTNCTRDLAETNLGYTSTEQKFFRLGWGRGGRGPPLNMPMPACDRYCPAIRPSVLEDDTVKYFVPIPAILFTSPTNLHHHHPCPHLVSTNTVPISSSSPL